MYAKSLNGHGMEHLKLSAADSSSGGHDSKIQKIMHCHDMMGGYNSDASILGVKSFDHYNFMHWDRIDIFTYFSHKRVTIPRMLLVMVLVN